MKSIGAQAMPFPAPVWVIGSYDAQGRPNVMTASWAGLCASKPPSVAVSLQRVRYSYENIMARRAFTISVPSTEYVAQADYFGLVSGKDTDKFAATGLTAVASELVDAPYVKEFPIVMECKVLHMLGVGSHVQFIAEILDVKVDDALAGSGGYPDAEKLGLFVLVDGYRAVGQYIGKSFGIGRHIR